MDLACRAPLFVGDESVAVELDERRREHGAQELPDPLRSGLFPPGSASWSLPACARFGAHWYASRRRGRGRMRWPSARRAAMPRLATENSR